MALTLTAVDGASTVFGNKRVRTYDVEFDTSYPTGGESLTPSDAGLAAIDAVLPHGAAVNSDGSGGTDAVAVVYDHTNQKLQAFRQTDPAAVGGAQVPLPEVTSTASLADFVVRVTFIGH